MTPFFPNSVARPPAFVLDVTVAGLWLLTHKANSYSDDVLARLIASAAAVPAGWPTELLQIALDAEVTGEKTAAEVDLFLARTRNGIIHLDDGREPHVWTDTLPHARQFGLPVARAAYLELAVRLGLPLATTDPALIAAAPAAGVARLTP